MEILKHKYVTYKTISIEYIRQHSILDTGRKRFIKVNDRAVEDLKIEKFNQQFSSFLGNTNGPKQ